MKLAEVKKTFIKADIPQALSRRDRVLQAVWGLLGGALSPIYWLVAHAYGVPGLRFHLYSAWMGLHLLLKRESPTTLGDVHHMLMFPIDSTRYFEFEFAWRCLANISIQRYLDISSPRLLPALLLYKHRDLRATLVNPDSTDLKITANLMYANRFAARCGFCERTIESAHFMPGSFDVITCISVIEHIPDDLQAVRVLWSLLRPGGRLVLSLPCAAEASDQYININYYGLPMDENGFALFQHIYDEACLREKFYNVTGPPVRYQIYGEKHPELLANNLSKKRSDPIYYPFWREPLMMGQEFTYFDSITMLPGEGVIGLEFVKS